MDRSKIKEATQLDLNLQSLEALMNCCTADRRDLDFFDLMCVLSVVGKGTVISAILYEANKDRIELERKIAEL
jgi:hypothetical protein